MIRVGSIQADVARITAVLRGRVDALAGAVRVVVHPVPDSRTDSPVTNTEVMGFLAQRNPDLTDPKGADLDAIVRPAARAVWRPRTMGLEALAVAAGNAFGRALAARLRSGNYVSNNEETRRRKAGRPGGIDTEQLADALDDATATAEGRE